MGVNMGSTCKGVVFQNGYCEQCFTREKLFLDLQAYTTAGEKCKGTDPYEGGDCDRYARYEGYCLYCLSDK